MENHIIICGYGRVGSWVGKVLTDFDIPFMVVEYNENVAATLKEKGIDVIYGDPAETEIMEAANIKDAKALVLAIPDIVAQENLIAYAQTVSPQLKIITRVHDEGDLEKLKALRVDKIVQPEFEAAVAIIRAILSSMGKNKDEITDVVKKIRISHAKN
ncbi:MAG: Transporter, CPA2 family [Candidatus Woesebacteria bacterium GW2011_GWA2_40_7]|uniref:Transporter, CPA2 family n=1 Tax=Candidatus Woesebacteria bacterium GW2011_GWA2_40_7 TaxID=1618562 RepID=A0A0G0T6B1_9BACT|nr:MAG: Transporter, CPA2 family [Candidatus Woesebacteria bacterium GW2011_GWA2_40_7]